MFTFSTTFSAFLLFDIAVAVPTAAYYSDGDKYGPDNWYLIAPKCGDVPTSKQSPIDIVTSVTAPLPYDIVKSGSCKSVTPTTDLIKDPSYRFLFPNDNTCIVNLSERNKALYMTVQYPSEHTVNGIRYDAEMHMVHQAVDDKDAPLAGTAIRFASLTILLQEDGNLMEDDPMLAALLTDMFKDTQTSKTPKTIPEPYLLFAPENAQLYTYRGSFNMEPCNEIVTWVVRTEPVKITSALLEAIKAANLKLDKAVKVAGDFQPGANVRPIQGTNGRTVNVGTVKVGVTAAVASGAFEQHRFSFAIFGLFLTSFLVKLL